MLAAPILATLLALQAQEPDTTPSDPGDAAPPAAVSARTPSGGTIEEPKKTKHVAPKWPENALRAGLDGPVALECVVGIDGRVNDVKVLSGYRSLAEAASAAVRKWRYTPTKLDGVNVPVIMTVTVRFRLGQPPKRKDTLASLRDSDPDVRWAAVKWLGRFRPIDAEQKSAIEFALRDSNELVRDAAQEALAKLEAK
jgi:TonB family protein